MLVAALVLALASACGSDPAKSDSGPLTGDIVQQAKEDGSVHAYWSVDDVTGKAVADAFKKKYGITLTFDRIPDSGALAARFTSEADAGASGADLIVNSDTNFFKKAVEDGYLMPVSDWNVPNIEKVPKAFVDDNFATVGLFQLNNVLVNTDAVPESEYPKNWSDVADPKWKGRVLSNDPRLVNVTMSIFNEVGKLEGDDWIKAIGALKPTLVQSLVSGAQTVAAGEVDMAFGIGQIHLNPLLASAPDAPVKLVRLDGPTFGAEWDIALAAKSKHKAAARLLADWLFSPEGQKVFNKLIGPAVLPGVSIEGFEPIPDEYVRLDPVAEADQPRILDLLGLSK